MNHPPNWRKSSRSNGQGECVELANLGSGVGIRDSKNPTSPHLSVTRQGLSSLLDSIKAGSLDFNTR